MRKIDLFALFFRFSSYFMGIKLTLHMFCHKTPLFNKSELFILSTISTTDETGAGGEEAVAEAEAAGHGKDSSLK